MDIPASAVEVLVTALEAWMMTFGPVARIGIEGASGLGRRASVFFFTGLPSPARPPSSLIRMRPLVQIQVGQQEHGLGRQIEPVSIVSC